MLTTLGFTLSLGSALGLGSQSIPDRSPSSSSDVGLQRDKRRCFITKIPAVMTLLYPQSMIAPYPAGATDTSVARFWKILKFLFDEDHLCPWKMDLLSLAL